MPSTIAAGVMHGGRLIAATRAFPDAPAPWIDLSTGISPFGYPVDSLPASCFSRLPEPEQEDALRAIAAEAYGAPDADHVVQAPGSQMVISLLPLLIPSRRVVVLHPGYAEHEVAWTRAGAVVLHADSVAVLGAEAAAGTVLVLCNPNNPDGRRIEAGVLAALVERCARVGAWLVVDEAYADLEPAVPQAARLLRRTSRLVVLRSFGKGYGLGGLRLGFLLAAPTLVRAMADLMGPWPVSGPALAIGARALADRDWRDEAIRRATGASARLEQVLRAAELDGSGGTSLFRFARTGNADHIWNLLARRGILVRRFREPSDALRFGLPADEAAWDRLGSALAATS